MSYASDQTHTSSGEIAISRDRYNRMRFSVIGLGLAFIGTVLFLLFNQPTVAAPSPLPNDAWIEDALDITIPPDVVETLENLGIGGVVYINNEAQIRVTMPDGTPVDVCADLRGTKIVERPGKSCGLKDITPLTEIQIKHFSHNPHGGCTSAGGKLAC